MSDWCRDGTDKVRLTDNDSWYSTDDIGRLGIDGQLHLVGRSGRLIKVAGRRVSLDRIEAVLITVPGVTDASR